MCCFCVDDLRVWGCVFMFLWELVLLCSRCDAVSDPLAPSDDDCVPEQALQPSTQRLMRSTLLHLSRMTVLAHTQTKHKEGVIPHKLCELPIISYNKAHESAAESLTRSIIMYRRSPSECPLFTTARLYVTEDKPQV